MFNLNKTIISEQKTYIEEPENYINKNFLCEYISASHNLTHCKKCSNSISSFYCNYCCNISHSQYCNNVNYSSNCTHCENSNNLHNCTYVTNSRDCNFCINCDNIQGLYGAKNINNYIYSFINFEPYMNIIKNYLKVLHCPNMTNTEIENKMRFLCCQKEHILELIDLGIPLRLFPIIKN